MPFYFRKSLRFGPIRFNLSKSGIGVSAGVRGLRVGTGPRGHYIQAGAGGFYYRNTFGYNRQQINSSAPQVAPTNPPRTPPLNPGYTDLRQIESADAANLVDADFSELIGELNRKRKKWRIAPLPIALASFCALVALAAENDRTAFFLAFLLFAVAAGFAAWFDRRRKTAVLFYDLAPPILGNFELLCASFDIMANCEKIWNIETEANVLDRKYSGGASKSISRQPSRLTTKEPPGVKTNISTPCIPVGRQELYFFPDRLLVFDPSGVGSVSYSELRLSAQNTRFLEEEGVPRDSQVVDRTWQYVNKKGGPDRRFRQNREIPVVLYGELSFSSASGLNERIQMSGADAYGPFVQAVSALAQSVTTLARADAPKKAVASAAKPR